MPRENRNIFFTENEVKIAMMQFSGRKGLKFTVENITEFELKADGEIAISMKVFDSAEGKAGTVDYDQAQIAAALMGYCMGLNIPLPKAGKKAVMAMDGILYLNIKLQS